jgi:predicted RNA-binding Zn ribbon-like protein
VLTHTQMMHVAMPFRSVTGRHAKARPATGTAQRALMAAFLLSCVATGSAAATGHAASSHMTGQAHASVKITPDTPWMY